MIKARLRASLISGLALTFGNSSCWFTDITQLRLPPHNGNVLLPFEGSHELSQLINSWSAEKCAATDLKIFSVMWMGYVLTKCDIYI